MNTEAHFAELLQLERLVHFRYNAIFDWLNVYCDRAFYEHARSKTPRVKGKFVMVAQEAPGQGIRAGEKMYKIDLTMPCTSTVHGDCEYELTRYQMDPRMGDLRQVLLSIRKDPVAVSTRKEIEGVITQLNDARARVLVDIDRELTSLAVDLPVVAGGEERVVFTVHAHRFASQGNSASYYARARCEVEGELVCAPIGIPFTVRAPAFDDGTRLFELLAPLDPAGWAIASRRANRDPAALLAVCRKLRVNPRVLFPMAITPEAAFT